MGNDDSSDKLRDLIRSVGQTAVARKANLSVATMSDFMTGRTRNFRSDTESLVLEAIEILKVLKAAASMKDAHLSDIVEAWEKMTPEQREHLTQPAKMLTKEK